MRLNRHHAGIMRPVEPSPTTPPPQPPPIPPYIRRRPVIAPARCLSCYYVIEGLTEPRCPECGAPFDPRDPTTFTRHPPFAFWPFWLPGFITAAVVGAVGAWALLMMGAWGWALWLATPIAAAALLGYRVRAGPIALVLLGVGLIGSLIFAIVSMNAAGVFCGLILAVIFLGPIMGGLAIGAAVRISLKTSNFSQRDYLPILVALLIPIGCGVIEIRTIQPQPLERITTSRIIEAPIAAAWDSIQFYEEVEHRPPLILRIGLAHPLFTSGSSRKVGDVKTCFYNKGHITKQVTEVRDQEILGFAVIEQHIGYERDVRLTQGYFAFEGVDENRTRITLLTEYEPLLTPRFAWRWGERIAVRTLHNHVIEGMAREAHKRTARPAEAFAMRSEHETDR